MNHLGMNQRYLSCLTCIPMNDAAAAALVLYLFCLYQFCGSLCTYSNLKHARSGAWKQLWQAFHLHDQRGAGIDRSGSILRARFRPADFVPPDLVPTAVIDLCSGQGLKKCSVKGSAGEPT